MQNPVDGAMGVCIYAMSHETVRGITGSMIDLDPNFYRKVRSSVKKV